MRRFTLWLSLGIFFLYSCDDDLSKVGTTIQDDDDKISVSVDTFNIDISTVLMDAVYAKTDTALIGEIYDPYYGTLKADYLCQFYCPENFKFYREPIDGKIDSIDFRMFYKSFIGDSLAPMQAQIYQITEPLERNYYTNINPEDYCDIKTPLGSQTYTAVDKSLPDSIRFETDEYGQYTFFPSVTIRIPKELGQKFYDESVNNPSTFATQENFNKYFPGLYVTNTFGSGSVLSISASYLTIYYKYQTKGSEGQDTIIKTSELFNVTKEIIQLNRYKNSDMEELLKPNEEFTYMKTPAGVCTRLIIPASDIAPYVENRIINNMPWSMFAMPQPEYDFSLTQPASLLLLPEDSVKTFFEKGQLPNNTTSFLADYSSGDYDFGNISNILKNHIENSPGEDLRILVIPVKHAKTTSSYYGTYTTGVSNFLYPAGMKLRKDKEKRTIVVTSSRYGKK